MEAAGQVDGFVILCVDCIDCTKKNCGAVRGGERRGDYLVERGGFGEGGVECIG